MATVVRFNTEDGSELFVEVDEEAFGTERITRGGRDAVLEVGEKLEDVLNRSLNSVRPVVEAVRRLAPDSHEIEFGLKLNAEVGMLVAKSVMEGHFTVKLVWNGAPEK